MKLKLIWKRNGNSKWSLWATVATTHCLTWSLVCLSFVIFVLAELAYLHYISTGDSYWTPDHIPWSLHLVSLIKTLLLLLFWWQLVVHSLPESHSWSFVPDHIPWSLHLVSLIKTLLLLLFWWQLVVHYQSLIVIFVPDHIPWSLHLVSMTLLLLLLVVHYQPESNWWATQHSMCMTKPFSV